MNSVNEWELPKIAEYIALNLDELLVLDWHLSGHYLCNVSRGLDIGEIITTWHSFRTQVWDGILALEDVQDKTVPYQLPMDEGTARYLFNWLPTTFMWGTGVDCGYSLKRKLALYLAGKEDNPNANTDEAPSDPKGETSPDAGT